MRYVISSGVKSFNVKKFRPFKFIWVPPHVEIINYLYSTTILRKGQEKAQFFYKLRFQLIIHFYQNT